VEGRRHGQAVIAIYRERLAARRGAVARAEMLHARISWARLSLFFVGVVLIVALRSASAPWLSIPILPSIMATC
jgi:hypothetical protein